MLRPTSWIIALCACFPTFGEEAIDFNRDIRPILSDKCFACHGPDEAARESGIRFDEKSGLFATTDDGKTMVVPGEPTKSELYARIVHPDPQERMPPPTFHLRMHEDEINKVRRWIEEGASWQGHWAFIPPSQVNVPPQTKNAWGYTSVDAFIVKRLDESGLSPSPDATQETLIRRVTQDLTGLPPTPKEIDAFLNDTSDTAYESLVDRLLASNRYGEHMAVSWMEVARYADTDGYQNDRYRYMHVWRDWLIESLNTNKPYDDFVIEQLAGDMLPNPTLRQQIATGFTRSNRINSENGSIPEEWLVEYVSDRVETVGTAFLGLTMNCARCHDHKYDPISQKEYYQLYAQFNRVPEWGVGPNNGNSPPFVRVPDSWPNLSPEEDKLIVPEPYKLSTNQGGVQRPQSGDIHTVMVMQEMETPRPTYRLRRGLYTDPDTSELLHPSAPKVLQTANTPAPSNRLELAQWLTSPDNPLFARVTVNRYWQHFFGTGLVKSVENFGLQGEYPSHPMLLDWLALEFIRLDWDVKALHKTIVMSATYRQQSNTTPQQLKRDPENRLISRGPRLRLSGQQLRDQALFSSGLLIEKTGGRSVKPYMPPGLWSSMTNETYDQGSGIDLYRRSMYTYWRRTTPPPMMTGFNAADRDVCSVRTVKTNSPLHALTMMNNPIFVESSRHLAERMLQSSSNVEGQIASGFRRLTARQPNALELSQLRKAYDDFHQQFAQSPLDAEALLHTGDSPHSTTLDPVDLASMSMVASAILNLDEVIMRN